MKFTMHKMRIKNICLCHRRQYRRWWRDAPQNEMMSSVKRNVTIFTYMNFLNIYLFSSSRSVKSIQPLSMALHLFFSSATSTTTTIECHFRSLVSSFKENSFTFAFRHSSFLKWLLVLLEIHRDII